MRKRSNARQELVNAVFARCMARDERTLHQIRTAIKKEWGNPPSDHELQIMISRNCMGEGEWEFFPAYSNPPRYVSRARVMELCALAEDGRLTEAQRAELRAQQQDLDNGIAHWRAKHQRARQKERELAALVDDISLRAFQGHYDQLL